MMASLSFFRSQVSVGLGIRDFFRQVCAVAASPGHFPACWYTDIRRARILTEPDW
jgi:hypothetical protein